MSKNIEEGKICAALSYILVGIIWYFVDEKMKKNTYAKFHVKQALVLIGFNIAIYILMAVLSVLIALLVFIPGLGALIGGLLGIISLLLWLALLVLWIIGIVNAFSGKENKLPVIGGFAKHLKF